jgi:hypothetical protein
VARHFIQEDHEVKLHFKVGIIDCALGNTENTAIREGFWISELQTVSSGINEKEEMNMTMDYQLVTLARHFNHSKTCLPYMTFHLQEVRMLSLNRYRRVIINPQRRIPFASALASRNDNQSRAASSILRYLRGT